MRNETNVAEEYCWAITAGGAVMLQQISFHYVGALVSAGLPFICVCSWLFQLIPELLEYIFRL